MQGAGSVIHMRKFVYVCVSCYAIATRVQLEPGGCETLSAMASRVLQPLERSDCCFMQVVVLSNILACSATMGYESTLGIKDSPVTAFNGTRINNLAQLALLVMNNTEDFLRFDLEAANKVFCSRLCVMGC